MAQNVVIAGATYSNVPSVNLPKVGGGVASFLDVNGSETFTENGTYDVSTLASVIVNVSASGGANVATGTITLSSATTKINISDLSFTPTNVIVINTASTANTSGLVRYANNDGSTLKCYSFTTSRLNANVAFATGNGTVTFENGTASLTGSGNFAQGTYKFICWSE